MNEKTKEFRQQVAEVFIKSLEEKQLNWKKDWNGLNMHPVNAISNKRYKGVNKFWLTIIAMERGMDDPRWCTFKQIQDKGWKLNKGSKGVKVEYWLPYDKREKKGISWEDFWKRKNDPSVILVTRYYVVFNGKDINGISLLPKLEENNISQSEIITRLSKNMGVDILHDGGDRAFYSIHEDKIHMPKAEHFKSDYGYNATALHELAHSSGALHRLNRDLNNMFGSSDYAYEELIAEISSCFMSSHLNIKQDESHINNHKAYVQSWIKAIKEKPETLIKAIREAEKTANYMEYNAELISEKDYKLTLNESIEVNDKDVQDDYEKYDKNTETQLTVLFRDDTSGLEAGINKDGNLYFGNNESGYNLNDTINNRHHIERDIERYTGQKINLVSTLKESIEVNYKYFYSGEQDEEANAFQQEKGWNKIWASDSQGMNGDTWIVYRNVDDLPKFLQNYAKGQENYDERKSLKDIQNNIAEYKRNNSYTKAEVNDKEGFIGQR